MHPPLHLQSTSLFHLMVSVNRANIRRPYRPGDRSLLSNINLSRLSSIDRLLLLCGLALLTVVSFSYFFLLSNIFSSSSLTDNDPRLSEKLRKIGLSKEALLRRGGGKRITVGSKQLDSEENAVALDIISTLNCDALQEELDRDWKTVLDGLVIRAEGYNSGSWKEEENFAFKGGGHVDDFAAELAQEVSAQKHKSNVGVDGNMRVDDHMNRRLLDNNKGIPDFDDGNPYGGQGHVDDFGRRNYGNSVTNQDYGLKLNAQHLFCLAADSLTLPKYKPTSTSVKDVKDPSIHCNIDSFEIRESLLYLWSSAKSQIPDDVLVKTLRLASEHKESLRGNDAYIWYPEGDKGTEGMLRVINSAYNGQAT